MNMIPYKNHFFKAVIKILYIRTKLLSRFRAK